MAELVAGPLISFVVERLGNLLIQEERFLHGAQVDQMRRELSHMQSFLKAADARREEGDELVRNYISEIRELSLDAEDVIATFVVKVALMRRGRIHPMLKRYFCIINESRARCTVGLEIKCINGKINELTRRLQTYGIQPIALGESSTSTTERVQQLRRSYPHVAEEDIISLDEDVKAIVDHLVNEMKNCRVVSIWGMGGLGKTTLAKMVYNRIDVRHHFDCFAWAYISQQCKTREVLEEILIQLTSPSLEGREKIRRMMHGELVGELYQAQSRMKCLVILDDIWDVEAWNNLSPAFPHKKAGSKILLTTRIREVASFADEQCLHELRHLTEPESWELFQKKACLKSDVTDAFPPNLTHLRLLTDGLKEDPMPTLEKLPNLRSLAVSGEWTEMLCSAGGFPQLIHLDVSCEHGAEWRVERGAMPSLLHLLINFRGRERLKEIPDGLRFVTTLRTLKIWSASQELKDRLREGGEDFSKVQHVHSIIFNG